MMNEKQQKPEAKQPEKAKYEAPRLTRWGTLRELTLGGGGNKKEPGTGARTRF